MHMINELSKTNVSHFEGFYCVTAADSAEQHSKGGIAFIDK